MRVFAFQGLRYASGPGPDPSQAGALAAPPYDQINDALRDRLQASSPNHFTHISRPLAGASDSPYREAAAIHARWLAAGVVVRDEQPSLYPYSIELRDGGRRLGLCALVGLEGPEHIRPHERTLDKPLADRLELLRATRLDQEPVFFLADDGGALDRLLEADSQGTPLVVHTDADGHRHVLYRVADPRRIAAYRDLLGPLPAAIADGHHRYKTAQLHAREIGAAPGTAAATKLAVITSVGAAHLTIDPIHRALRAVPALGGAASIALERVPWKGEGGWPFARAVAHSPAPALGVWPAGGSPEIWHLDAGRAPEGVSPAAARLSVVLLHEVFLASLGFSADSATDGTVLYRSNPDELAEMVVGGDVALGLFLPPMAPSEFAAAIAHGELLPPKSTRFLPKVFAGLVWAGHDARLA